MEFDLYQAFVVKGFWIFEDRFQEIEIAKLIDCITTNEFWEELSIKRSTRRKRFSSEGSLLGWIQVQLITDPNATCMALNPKIEYREVDEDRIRYEHVQRYFFLLQDNIAEGT